MFEHLGHSDGQMVVVVMVMVMEMGKAIAIPVSPVVIWIAIPHCLIQIQSKKIRILRVERSTQVCEKEPMIEMGMEMGIGMGMGIEIEIAQEMGKEMEMEMGMEMIE